MGAASNPCTGVCKFNDGLCLSCGRLRSEKKRWKRMDKAERRRVVTQAAARVTALGDQAIPSKKARRKAKKQSGALTASHTPGSAVRVPANSLELGTPALQADAPLPVVDREADKAARKAWKKARKHARKAKKAARKAREAEALARGLPPHEHAAAMRPERRRQRPAQEEVSQRPARRAASN